MQIITPDNHPDFIAVIDGRSALRSAFMQAQDALLLPRYTAAVILRHSPDTLPQSWRRAARMLDRSMSGSLMIKNNAAESGDFTVESWKDLKRRKISDRTVSPARLLKLIGEDLVEFTTALQSCFPQLDDMQLRRNDGGNSVLHIDRNNRRRKTHLPGGLTAVMAVHGGGTIIAEELPGTLEHGKTPVGHMEWTYKGLFTSDPELEWQVATGDIAVMRSRDWPQTHKPCVHRSPLRQHPGDAKERVVGVVLS